MSLDNYSDNFCYFVNPEGTVRYIHRIFDHFDYIIVLALLLVLLILLVDEVKAHLRRTTGGPPAS